MEVEKQHFRFCANRLLFGSPLRNAHRLYGCVRAVPSPYHVPGDSRRNDRLWRYQKLHIRLITVSRGRSIQKPADVTQDTTGVLEKVDLQVKARAFDYAHVFVHP